MARLIKLPFLVILMAASAAAMLVPAAHAARIGDYFTARIFVECGLLIFLLTAMIGIATYNRPPATNARSQLIALLAAYFVLPLVLAFPMLFFNTKATAFDLYFEMLSCLTTTGATVFSPSSHVPEPVHLWRALVGWLGGFLILVSAFAIFSPMNLGGFEVYASKAASGRASGLARIKAADASDRLASFARSLAPFYLTATVVLAIGLTISGARPFSAAILAMSTLSTSGITAGSGMRVGFVGEGMILIFLLFAVSRVLTPLDRRVPKFSEVKQDHELHLMLIFLVALVTFLVLRHAIAATGLEGKNGFIAALNAAWGSVFMVVSFLTTTGFVSASWHDTELWSGLESSGIILLGLAVMGGGVATTAGGIKLLRVYALYKHGTRELQKLSYPSSVGGAGGAARHIRREGAYVSWMFFMLFAISTAVVMLGLSLSGLTFEESLAYGTAALSTTGPLADAVMGTSVGYGGLSPWAKGILAVAMVLGRLETLAIIAILNPEFWRR